MLRTNDCISFCVCVCICVPCKYLGCFCAFHLHHPQHGTCRRSAEKSRFPSQDVDLSCVCQGNNQPLICSQEWEIEARLKTGGFEVSWSQQRIAEDQFIWGRKDAFLKIHEESMTFVQSGLNQNESGENGSRWKQGKGTFNNITALNIDVINFYSRAEASMECWKSFERSSQCKCLIGQGIRVILEQCAFFILSHCNIKCLYTGMFTIIGLFETIEQFLISQQICIKTA